MTGVAVEAQAAWAVNLCKTYGAGHAIVRALDNVSVAFERGRFTAVMGPSGSGKSTLMHCMAGLDRPTSGQAYVGGEDIGQLDDSGLTKLRRDRIGFVFQYFNLVPTLTAGENIALPVALAGRKPDQAWVDYLTRQLGIADRLTHRPSELSGGQRMAREIHDTLAQGLTGIVTQLQAAERATERTPADPAGWRRHVAAATRLARESLIEARRSVDALRPEPLEGCRLSEALTDVAARWSAMNVIPVQVTTTGTARPIDPEAEFALLRAAQEALANVARHAHATRVGLTVSYMENEVALDVRDDGVGFDPAALGHGFGLVAMRQRIAGLSGTLQVESEPGGGTAVSVCVPTVPTGPSAATLVRS